MKHIVYVLDKPLNETWTKEEISRLAEEKARKRAADLAALLDTAPEHMSLKNEAAWKKYVEVNKTDSYSNGVIVFAKLWARLMEANIAAGKTIEDCADECSHLADTDGITGFMYGCAVSILAQVWLHGEILRRWHNKKTQIGTEGDKANETGGVLNPALLSIRA